LSSGDVERGSTNQQNVNAKVKLGPRPVGGHHPPIALDGERDAGAITKREACGLGGGPQFGGSGGISRRECYPLNPKRLDPAKDAVYRVVVPSHSGQRLRQIDRGHTRPGKRIGNALAAGLVK
jgi:hypothetical protein